MVALRDAGLLRHVSPIFDGEALGYATCLVAMRVPEDRLAAAAEIVNAHPGVSHNYRRDHAFNMWFTIAVPPGSDVLAHVQALHALAGAESTRPLPAVRRYKIGVSLDVTGERAMDERSQPRHTGGHSEDVAPKSALTQREIDVIRAVQGDLPLQAHPFADAAGRLNMGEEQLVDVLDDLRRRGCLRRFAGSCATGRPASARTAWPCGTCPTPAPALWAKRWPPTRRSATATSGRATTTGRTTCSR